MRSVVLRIVLCMCLVLDQSVAAMAAARMPFGQPTHAGMSMPASMHTTDSHCERQDAAMGHSGKRTTPALPDCCLSGFCVCACAMQATIAFPAISLPQAVHTQAVATHALVRELPAPALPQPIRPPIDPVS